MPELLPRYKGVLLPALSKRGVAAATRDDKDIELLTGNFCNAVLYNYFGSGAEPATFAAPSTI
jgi:hypothetical protein